MSVHNGTPNVVKYNYKDIIRVFLDDFKKDFDCVDVKDILRKILTKKDIDAIVKSGQTRQTYRLFWKLYDQSDKAVQEFVEDILKEYYAFLMSPIQNERLMPSSDTEQYISELDRLRNDNQRFTEYNVSRIEPYLQLQNALLELRPGKNVLVEGVLGAGKQWLALDVCSSYAVQRKMDFKIFWINVRDCHTPEKDLELLQMIFHQIDPTWLRNSDHSNGCGIEQRIVNIKIELQRLLKSKPYKNCLLVLRNVQNVKTCKTFNLGCKILLTTRYKSVTEYLSSVTTNHVPLSDNLTSDEVESLFVKYLRKAPQDLPDEALKKVAKRPNPRILSILAERVRDGLVNWDNWKHVNSDKLTTIIENSLKRLKPKYRQLYNKLFIFPESANIPINLLVLVWSDSTPICDDPRKIIEKLLKYSLVEKLDLPGNELTIKLPSIYLELCLSNVNEAPLHQKIVDSYSISTVFDQSTDTVLSKLDSYFYRHIGHHLSKLDSSAKSVELFRKIFLDFRFLDHKIRQDTTAWNASGSILNTMQQLKLYTQRIVDNDPEYECLVNSLLDFLPKAEEKLIRSRFTCLLRVALMAEEEPVYKAACRQVQRFPDHVWFTDHGRFHQHRQIINLGEHQVKHALYLDNDFCLMALDNQKLLLADVSLEAETIYLLTDNNDPSEIIEMCAFNQQRHLLTLHSNGSLKLWSLWEDFSRRPSQPCYSSGSRQRVPPPQQSYIPKNTSSRCYKQLINDTVKRLMGIDKKISAFYLDQEAVEPHTSIQLHIAFDNGDICICDWDIRDQEFKFSQTPALKTRQMHVRCFAKVMRFYVLSTANCTLTVWDVRDGSKVPVELSCFASTPDTALTMDTYKERINNGVYTTLLLICAYSVWRLRFEHKDFACINPLQPKLLHFREKCTGAITCAKRSLDGCYLILGTQTEGLIVYNLKLSESVLRLNVSEHIACVDIYELRDDIFKYIVVCGAVGKHLLHVHTLRQSDYGDATYLRNTDDAHTENMKGVTRARLEPNVYLLPLIDMADRSTQLFVVDSKQRIHQIQTDISQRSDGTSGWSTITPRQTETNQQRITALCAYDDAHIFAGYDDGRIVNVNIDEVLPQKFIVERIDYLKQINTRILVASASSVHKTLIFNLAGMNLTPAAASVPHWPLELNVDTMYARLFEEHVLLLFSEHAIYHVNISNPMEISCLLEMEKQLVGFDLKNNLLFLGLIDSRIKVVQLAMYDKVKNLSIHERCCEKIKDQDEIKYLVASTDGDLFAVGFRNGTIQLYTYGSNKILLIYNIAKVHDQPIRRLRFSPCKQVLVSCAEQLCFWSVTHMRNNQLEANNQQGRSFRFKSNRVAHEEIDALPYRSYESASSFRPHNEHCKAALQHQQTSTKEATLWRDKRGNMSMPELLACIKFVGNAAYRFFANDDFTEFYVIDDEGVFYHLQLLQNSAYAELEPIGRPLRQINTLGYENVADLRLIEHPLAEDEADDDGIDVVGNSTDLIKGRPYPI